MIGWARPFRFTPLPFGSFLFPFHLLRGSLVYPRLTSDCLCSHFSFPRLPPHATMLSVLVSLIWSLLNSLLYGLSFLATLQLNLSILSTYLLTLQTIQKSSTILTPK